MLLIALGLLFLSLPISIVSLHDETFYQSWVEKYRQVSGNQEPPLKYKEWINVADELQVSSDPGDYSRVFEDINYFRSTEPLTVEYLKGYEGKIRRLGKPIGGKTMDELKRISSQDLKYVSRVLDPDTPFYQLYHTYDEGMVIPDERDPERPYHSMDDVFGRIPAFKEEHGQYQDKCMLLQAPCSLLAIPYKVPVFSICRVRGYKDIIQPNRRTGLGPYESHIHFAIGAPAWENKIGKAVFRGSTTGIDFGLARARNFPLINNPRFKLHEMSILQRQRKLNCSVPLDFGIVSFNQFYLGPHYGNEIQRQFPFVSTMDYETQFKHKYLVVVDGHGWPDRLAFFMASGSLVFLASLHNDWAIDQVTDGENVVIIKPDLSDLVEKLEWAAQNDAEAKRIAQNGRKFALKMFGARNQQAYNALLFMEYQTLFKQ